jgi:hypothetical protein
MGLSRSSYNSDTSNIRYSTRTSLRLIRIFGSVSVNFVHALPHPVGQRHTHRVRHRNMSRTTANALCRLLDPHPHCSISTSTHLRLDQVRTVRGVFQTACSPSHDASTCGLIRMGSPASSISCGRHVLPTLLGPKTRLRHPSSLTQGSALRLGLGSGSKCHSTHIIIHQSQNTKKRACGE